MVANRRTEEPGGRTAKPPVSAKHQDLRGGLVDDGERIPLAVIRCDHPSRELDDGGGHVLALRKLIDGGDGSRGCIFRAGRAKTGECQREGQCTIDGARRGMSACTDGTSSVELELRKDAKDLGGG